MKDQNGVSKEFKVMVKEEADKLKDFYLNNGFTPSPELWSYRLEERVTKRMNE